jgi:hypothetical protein
MSYRRNGTLSSNEARALKTTRSAPGLASAPLNPIPEDPDVHESARRHCDSATDTLSVDPKLAEANIADTKQQGRTVSELDCHGPRPRTVHS